MKNPTIIPKGLGILLHSKILKTMKLATLFSFLTLLNIHAKTYSQEEKLTLTFENTPIQTILMDIEKKTNVRFLYRDETVSNINVNISVSNASIKDILKKTFENTQLTYTLLANDLVVIATKESLQQQKVSGTITDAATGEPIIGATIIIEGTTIGTTSDINGKYTLDIPNSDVVIQVSYVGYKPIKMSVNGQSLIDFKFEADVTKLDEIVVVGYGTQKKATLTGSINTVKGKEVTEAPVANVTNSLAGRMAGLVAVTASGEPGSDGSTLRIRGSNTFNDNSVLIVVDGVPDRSLERIDPYSIESVTVLKDASAAIYGSRAANGVILVTTKRGNIGKPELTFNTEFGYNQPTKLPKMADAATYATMLNEVNLYDNKAPDYTAEQIQKFKDGSDPWRYPNTDWFKTVIKPRSAQSSQNLTISGGTEAMKYFVSLGIMHQDGNYYHSATYYNQYNFRSNIDGKITKDISIGVDVSGRLEDKNYPVSSASNIFRGLIQSYPTSVAVWPNGEPGPAIENGRAPVVTSTDASGYNRDKYYVLNTNFKLDVNIPWVKGLSFSGNLSYDQGFDFTKTFSKPYKLYSLDHVDSNGNPILSSATYGGGTDNTPSLTESFKSDYTRLGYGVINYEITIDENQNLKLMVGSQVSKGNTESFNVYRDYFLSTSIQEIFAGQTNHQITGGTGTVNSRLSYFGRANYSYGNKYLVEFVGRYDGSYIFPENKRFGFFPGASVGWVASQENFWKDNIKVIDYFKLRGSWGQTGNDRVLPFQYLTSYLFGYQYGKIYDSNTTYNVPFVVNTASGLSELKNIYESVLANPNITWEVSDQFNIGFNAGFFNSKLSLEADYFDYRRSNILWPQSGNVPLSAGITLPSVNYAKSSNRGFDGTISFKDNINGKFGYSISFNAGYAKNKVIEWGETPGAPEWQQTTGHPMGSGLYYLADGIYHTADDIPSDLTYKIGTTPAPGDVKFIDYNEDGVIDANDKVRLYKNNIPQLTFGSNINLNYKGFDLSILIQGATGAEASIFSEAGKFGNYLQSFADARWTPDNTSANGPRTFNRGNFYWAQSDNTYWLHKADYVRLKTLQLGYTIPPKVLQKTGLKKLRVYVSGYNLFTYCPGIKDFDPEMGASSSPTGAASSITGYNYPLERVVSMGLTVGF